MDFWNEYVIGHKSADFQPSVLQPLVGTVVYAVVVYGLKKYEASRTTKLDLKNVAIAHNAFLVTFSVVLAVLSFIDLAQRSYWEGFDGLFCSGTVPSPGTILDGPAGVYMALYYFSKYYELLDTFLMCLKGRETIPLHLYHHGIMMWATWAWVRYDIYEGALWCVCINSVIHAVMYTYYLLAVLGQRVWWKKYLTTAQIIQFCSGFVYLGIFLYLSHTRHYGCGDMTRTYIMWATHFANVSLLVLFGMFYKKAYTPKKRDPKEVATELLQEEAKAEADAKAAAQRGKKQQHYIRKRK